ncbi:MAG: Methyltransferase FkbM family [Methanobacteriaceae archaeon 41_258]|nr:MAG: Methyltransferase FkbM family [Methanobacteriaceae archaeon 41_258]
MSKKFYWTTKIFQSTNNPFSVLLFRLGVFSECECDFRQLGVVKLTKRDIESGLFPALLSISPHKLNINWKVAKLLVDQKDKEVINIKPLNLKIMNVALSSFFETFVEEPYHVPSTDKDKIVIDIGGNVGDTALYFANKGYRVYSFEPIPEVYQVALKNIKLNSHLADKITFVNKAVNSKEGRAKISYQGLNKGGESSILIKADNALEVNTITLKRILKQYEIEDPYLLKMDCEGCEYKIIKEQDLQMFNKIILEYHTFLIKKPPETIIEKLKNEDFKIEKRMDNRFLGISILHFSKK